MDEVYWRGRPISELTREELIAVIKTLVRQQDEAHRQRAEDLDYIIGIGASRVNPTTPPR